jgi:small subunit ribosomal protein S9
MLDFNYGTGKRKNAVARTRIYQGTGQILINERPFEDYFPRKTLQMIVQQALKLTKLADKFDIKVNVCGGGVAGQAQAVRHGIARALIEMDPELRGTLKRAGFLTREIGRAHV